MIASNGIKVTLGKTAHRSLYRVLRNGRDTGYYITRGAFVGTNGDRLDRWYADSPHVDYLDRRGPGYATREAALEAVAGVLAYELV